MHWKSVQSLAQGSTVKLLTSISWKPPKFWFQGLYWAALLVVFAFPQTVSEGICLCHPPCFISMVTGCCSGLFPQPGWDGRSVLPCPTFFYEVIKPSSSFLKNFKGAVTVLFDLVIIPGHSPWESDVGTRDWPGRLSVTPHLIVSFPAIYQSCFPLQVSPWFSCLGT